jgi:hypothetical protein
VPRATRDSARFLKLSTTGLSPSLVQSQLLRLTAKSMSLSHNPNSKNHWFRLFPLRSPLLGESLLLSLPPATKMFQFAGFARTMPMDSAGRILGCPIRKPPDQCLLPAPRSVSSVATSFFASACLGIHREPFVA